MQSLRKRPGFVIALRALGVISSLGFMYLSVFSFIKASEGGAMEWGFAYFLSILVVVFGISMIIFACLFRSKWVEPEFRVD